MSTGIIVTDELKHIAIRFNEISTLLFQDMKEIAKPMSILRTICSKKQEESLPLSPQGLITHGSISVDQIKDKESLKLTEKTKNKEDESKKTNGMTWKRRVVFVASFNTWILYLAAFLWIIPCREPICKRPQNWKFLLQNVEITTNLEVFKSSLFDDDLLIFGYRDTKNGSLRTEGHLAALNSKDGSVVWKRTLLGIPTKIQCSVGEIGSCLATSRNSLTMFNATNGYLLWFQISSPAIIEGTSVVILACSHGKSKTLYAAGLEGLSRQDMDRVILTVADTISGMRQRTASVPCDQLPLRLMPWIRGNSTDIVLVCSQGKNTDILIIPEEFICSSNFSSSSITENSFVTLSSLVDNVVQSVLLATEAGLMIASSRSVVMFTTDDYELWEIKFPESIVTCAAEGKFLKKNVKHIALGLKELISEEYEIILVEESSGEKIMSLPIDSGKLKSLRIIPGVSIDFGLLEMEENNAGPYKNDDHDTFFYLVNFTKKDKFLPVLNTSLSNGDGVGISVSKDVRLEFFEQTTNKSVMIVGHVLSNKELGNNLNFKILCTNCDNICS